MLKNTKNVIITILILVNFVALAGGEQQEFSEIIESTKSFSIKAGEEPMFITFTIDSATETLYWLHCFAGNDEALDKLSDRTEVNFVAPFACRLSQEDETFSELTLLTEKTRTSYWHSRGRFAIRDLENGCGIETDYGKIRNFRLRGFHLTLEVSNIKRVDNNYNFDFHVIVENDPQAKNAKPEATQSKRIRWQNGKCI